MTEYEKEAIKTADEYYALRKKQAQEAVDQSNAAYAAQLEEVQTEAGDAIRREDQAVLDALDTAAVEEAVTRQQVREAMANWGLSASGTEQAHLQAARSAAVRQGERAVRERDSAVKALTEALQRTEQEIETARVAAESREIRDAEQDIWEQEDKLLMAAWDAEAKEEAARIKAEQKEASDKRKAELEAEKEANKAKKVTESEKNRIEQNRRSALLQLLKTDQLTIELYALALEGGWSVQKALDEQNSWSEENRKVSTALLIYEDYGFEAVMKHMKERYSLKEVYEICDYLGIGSDRVLEWYEKGGK